MKYRKVGGYVGVCIFYLIITGIVALFYTHKTDLGEYKFNNYRFLIGNEISEYSSSSLVAFPIKGDYSDLVNQDVYYYDNNALVKGKLTYISLSEGRFKIDDIEHNRTDFLGRPSFGIVAFGSIMNFLTIKDVFISMLVLAGLCVLYLLYVIINSFSKKKNY